MTEVLVPPIKIQGIKTKLVPFIKSNLPETPIGVWVEPFMGSGVVGFSIAPPVAIFADLNPHLIAFYQEVKTGKITSKIVREFLEFEGNLLSTLNENHYYTVRERFNRDHAPLDFLFLNRSCFNGMIRFNRNLAFNVPFGHKPERFSKAYITKIVNQVARVEALIRMNDWTFICQSYEKTIAVADENTFVYCDPPYIDRHVDYFDSWDETSEITLEKTLRESGARFMLSTWDHNVHRNNKYLDLIWKEYIKVTQPHFYFVGAKEENRGEMIEALLMNYQVTGRGITTKKKLFVEQLPLLV